jgi:hypothetical protein
MVRQHAGNSHNSAPDNKFIHHHRTFLVIQCKFQPVYNQEFVTLTLKRKEYTSVQRTIELFK